MSLLNKILSVFSSQNEKSLDVTPEISSFIDFRKQLSSLDETDCYIAKSDYASKRKELTNEKPRQDQRHRLRRASHRREGKAQGMPRRMQGA